MFYNNGAFDTTSDDAAIATDKQALRPGGGGGSFANVTTYTKGINGLFIDVANLPAGVTLTAADFGFRFGKTANRATWQTAAAPLSIDIRRGAGVDGSDRVVVIWSDYNPLPGVVGVAVANAWLEVTVNANARTGLSASDVFYFGNLVGETGDTTAAAAAVGAADLVRMSEFHRRHADDGHHQRVRLQPRRPRQRRRPRPRPQQRGRRAAGAVARRAAGLSRAPRGVRPGGRVQRQPHHVDHEAVG